MNFAAADITAMLSAMGETATVAGGSLRVLFEAPGRVADGLGGVLVTDPTALAAESDIASLGIVAGESGSAITIGGKAYTVLAIVPDGDGFATMTLEAA